MPHAESAGAELNDVEVSYVSFQDVTDEYEEDQFFGYLVRAIRVNWPPNGKERLKIEKIFPIVRMDVNRFFYNRKVFLPRQCVSTIFSIAHDARLGGNFKFSKML